MNSWERKLLIINTFHFCRFTTYQLLADLCGVSKSTISRDIDELGSVIPICSEAGRYGGIYVPDDWSQKTQFLTSDEELFLEHLKYDLEANDKRILNGIIRKFSMSKINKQ